MRIAAAALLISGLSFAAQAATAVACPASLSIKSSVQTPKGWELLPPRHKNLLDGITIYDGHPREMASLAPEELPAKDQLVIVQWDINDSTWLECRYSGTHQTIAKKLPKGLKTCRAYYEQPEAEGAPVGAFVKLECE